uniref:Uncharacterized protein n=1 Tax=Rhizophora mucronata TaxID=61149 RepID=A0A2P2PLQ7_RHIMU
MCTTKSCVCFVKLDAGARHPCCRVSCTRQ